MAVDYSQFKGKPFQVVSKLGVRYTGIFDHINQDDQTICLAQVYNHGTEDRPTARKLPGSDKSLGWVRFHTESIESLALVENYVPPGEEAPVDPILAPSHDLPPRPTGGATSAATALDRVQRSLSDLHVAGEERPRHRQQRHQPPAVPDANFDFSAGTEQFEKEREALKHKSQDEGEAGENSQVSSADVGEPDAPPHPSAVLASPPVEEKPPKQQYNKSSFFDNLSNASARVSRADERHRNFDTFGEAGGPGQGQGQGGFGGRGRGRGGYGGQQRGRGYNQGGGGGYRGGRGGYGGQGDGQRQYGGYRQPRQEEAFQ